MNAATRRWGMGLIATASMSVAIYTANRVAAATADYNSHKVENARDIASTKQQLADLVDSTHRIEMKVDMLLERRSHEVAREP